MGKSSKSSLRLIGVFFIAALAFVMSNHVSGEKFQYQGVYYEITGENTAKVARDLDYNGEIVILPEVEFEGQFYTVNEIADFAFNFTVIPSVTIPNTIKYIGESAFSSCFRLKEIRLPDSVESIGDNCFSYSTDLKTVYFGEKISRIDPLIFRSCDRLENIEVAVSNPKYTSKTGAVYSKDMTTLIAWPHASPFYWLFMPSSVTKLGKYSVFENIMKGVEIPAKWEEIEEGAFALCKLTNIDLNPDCTNFHLIDGILYDKDLTILLASEEKVTQVIFPESLITIGAYSLYENEEIDNLVLPAALKRIGSSAFRDCINMKEVTGGINLEKIESYAFFGCENLERFETGDALKIIDDYAFNTNLELQDFHLSTSLEKIGNSALPKINCETLDLSNFPLEYIGNKVFRDNNYIKSVKLPSVLKHLGEYSFLRCKNLKEIELHATTTSIGYASFAYCESLESAILDSQILDIPTACFTSCVSLKDFVIPESVIKIGNYVFQDDCELTHIRVQENVQEIGRYTFCGCNKLENIELPQGLTSLGFGTFAECTSLKPFQLPEHLTKIEKSLFLGCEAFHEFKIHDRITSIEERAFEWCENLKKITIGREVSKIDDNAFRFCYKLTSVTCFADEPPILTSENVFTRNTYNGVLYVPAESYELYLEAPFWNKFYDIKPIDNTGSNDGDDSEGDNGDNDQEGGVNTIEGDSQIYKIFDLSGQYVGNSDEIQNLKPGIYIIAGKKIIIK